MCPLNKKLLNEKGLTLVEMLAAIILVSMISLFSISLIVQSMDTTREVQIESQFRDEADLIVSKFMKELYSTRQTDIIQNETGTGYSYLNVTTDPTKCKRDETTGHWILNATCNGTFKKTGFVTNSAGVTQLVLKDEPHDVLNSNIKILSNSTIIGDPNTSNSYEILLKLEYKTTRGGKEIKKEMDFKNTIQPF